MFVKWINGAAVKDGPLQLAKYPPCSHLHPSGHSTATLAGRITNQNQNTTAGAANSSDTNNTVRLDGVASCWNLQREREEMILNVIVLVVRVRGGQYRDIMGGHSKLWS